MKREIHCSRYAKRTLRQHVDVDMYSLTRTYGYGWMVISTYDQNNAYRWILYTGVRTLSNNTGCVTKRYERILKEEYTRDGITVIKNTDT